MVENSRKVQMIHSKKINFPPTLTPSNQFFSIKVTRFLYLSELFCADTNIVYECVLVYIFVFIPFSFLQKEVYCIHCSDLGLSIHSFIYV